MFARISRRPLMLVCSNFALRCASSNYVDRTKYEQRLKLDNSECFTALEDGVFVYYFKSKVLVRKQGKIPVKPLWISYKETHHVFSKIKERFTTKENCVLIDIDMNNRARFALQLHPIEDRKIGLVENMFSARFVDLRLLLSQFPQEIVQTLSKGRSLLYWHKTSTFCSKCGSKTTRNTAGTHRVCTLCRQLHYPTLSPVILVLVTSKNRCVLVRQPRHTVGLYSAIAGFVESGETVEQAISREVAEEIGFEIDSIQYVLSQHWPYPLSSLMIGYIATTSSDKQFDLDKHEIEDAKWFDAKTVKTALELVERNPSIVFIPQQNQLMVPPPGLIANSLIKEWLKNFS